MARKRISLVEVAGGAWIVATKADLPRKLAAANLLPRRSQEPRPSHRDKFSEILMFKETSKYNKTFKMGRSFGGYCGRSVAFSKIKASQKSGDKPGKYGFEKFVNDYGSFRESHCDSEAPSPVPLHAPLRDLSVLAPTCASLARGGLGSHCRLVEVLTPLSLVS